MALTCPICGIAISDGIEICPKCHSRIMPPIEKAARQPAPATQKQHPEIQIPKTRDVSGDMGVPPTIHAIEQSVAQVREQKKSP
ncbi:MAG: hypothetical protein JW738_04120, partial [Actinobacteria bacterium]|nr:hypothetical protein [Actinomycetota bacterium]